MPNPKNIKFTIGGEEAAAGTPHAMENVIPIRGTPSLTKKAEKQTDPAIVGNNMDIGEFLMAYDVKGNIPLTPRACPGFGKLLVSLLHTESVPAQISSALRIRYTGASASCKLISTAGMTLSAQVGALGAEVDDAAWNFGADRDLTAVTRHHILAAAGYIACVPGDIGLPVVGADSGHTGVLLDYANATREWYISTTDLFDDINEALSITGGTGAGTVDGAASTLCHRSLAFSATGYVNCVATDVGKAVAGTISGDAGILISFNNDMRIWVIRATDLFAVAEGITIAAGTGAGTTTGASTALTEYSIGELEREAEAFAGYAANILFGSPATPASDNITKTTQAKSKWGYLWFTSAGSGAYMRYYEADLTDAERPTYTIQGDGFQDNFLFAGCVVDSMKLTAALKGMVEADVEILGFSETEGQVASALTLEDAYPLRFWQGSFTIDDTEYTFIRNISVDIKNNHNPEGYGQGSAGRIYHQKAKFEITGEMTVRLDANTYAHRAKIFNNTLISISFYFKGKDIATGIPELLLIEIPFWAISDYDTPENNGAFDAKFTLRALNPAGSQWDEPIRVTLITDDAGAF